MRDDAVALLQRLIACNTSNPPGNEAQAVAVLENYLGPFGIELERVAKNPERPNLIARLPGGDGPSLAFLGHADVVQARREHWQVEPFAGVVQDGWIWGRGAVDMKCWVAATAVALASLAAEDVTPAGDRLLIILADEEVGDEAVGAPYLVEAKPDLKPDFIVGEGAGERYETERGPVYLLDRGVNGSVHTTLKVRGRAGDASLPDALPNAAYELARLLARFEERDRPHRVLPEVEELASYRGSNEWLDHIIEALTTNVFTPTTIEASGPPNAVIEEVTANIYGAVLPGATEDEVEAELRAAFGDGDYELEVGDLKAGSTSATGTPLQAAIEAFLGERDPEARLIPALGYGYSDCQTMRESYGSVAYGFIPFRHVDPAVNLAAKHGVDERILVDDLLFQVDAARHLVVSDLT